MDIVQTNQESNFEQIYICQNNDFNKNEIVAHHISETTIQQELKTEFEETIKEEYEVDIDNNEQGITLLDPVVYLTDEGGIKEDFEENNEIISNLILIKKEVDQFQTESDNDISENHCFHDKEAYIGYCTKCAILSRILHNCLISNIDKGIIQTIPKKLLEIQRDSSIDSKVFALRTIPKNVIFGPFAGGWITAENRNGSMWKIKNGKLLNDIETNWMEFVNCTNNVILRNLEMFQYENNLYFRTCREIDRNGELLIYYADEYVTSKEDEICYCPVIENGFPDVYACTFCCLGYRSKQYLIEHKKWCPELNVNDFGEIIHCDSCKIYLEQHEYMEYHLSYCLEKQERLSKFSAEIYPNNINLSNNTNQEEYVSTSQTNIDNASEITKPFKCTQCLYQSKYRSNLYQHLNTHKAVKPFRCHVCMLTFVRKDKLILHIKNKHTQGIPKDYKCPQCPYETNRKSDYQIHQNIHTGIKLYQCDICMMGFNKNSNLKRHVKDIHMKRRTKDYKCSHCTYETNHKAHIKRHLETHTAVKSFQCELCTTGFSEKSRLIRHIKDKHEETKEKDFKCPQCSYQTNHKSDFQRHFNTHGDGKLECDICLRKFQQTGDLKRHIGYKHLNKVTNEYKCSECTFKTEHRTTLQEHFRKHIEHKPFSCHVCDMRFRNKINMRKHMKEKHAIEIEKDFECLHAQCNYQTNNKDEFQNHLNTHNDVKPIHCDICLMGFNRKDCLIPHMKNKHGEGNGKEYKCASCSYETNYKSNLQKHFNIHKDIKEFRCDKCMLEFRHHSSLKKHMKKKH